MRKGLKIIFTVLFFILFAVVFIIVALSDIRNAQEIIRKYVEESDYYFSGHIIEEYSFREQYNRYIVVKPDSIHLNKISNGGFMAAYNKDLEEVVFLAGFSRDSITPSYVIVNSVADTITYDKYEGEPVGKLNPIRVTQHRENLARILKEKGGDWVLF